jgi:Phosphotransferase enzyme family
MSHRQFLAELASDLDRLEAVRKWCINELGEKCSAEFVAGKAETVNEAVKSLVTVVARNRSHCAKSHFSDIRRLTHICKRESNIRERLRDVTIWNDVLMRLGHRQFSVQHVDVMQTKGHCNLHYRLRAGGTRLVVRYHDPLGKDFLQRHEPARAVLIYRVMEELAALCIGGSQVVRAIAPGIDFAIAACGQIADENEADIADIVSQRVIVQNDEEVDATTLDDFLASDTHADIEAAAVRFAKPLGRLHGASLGCTNSSGVNAFLAHFRQFRHLNRFPVCDRYAGWLLGPNWISTRTLSGLAPTAPDDSIWGMLARRSGITRDGLLARCYRLWHDSGQAASVGALGHLDYAPWNCFIDHATGTRLRVFDFDYVAVVDPAYDAGLAASTFLKYAVMVRHLDKSAAMTLVSLFLDSYSDELSSVPALAMPAADRAAETTTIRSRAMGFAALALAARLHSPRSFPSNPSAQAPSHFRRNSAEADGVLAEACVQLLQPIL